MLPAHAMAEGSGGTGLRLPQKQTGWGRYRSAVHRIAVLPKEQCCSLQMVPAAHQP